nr:hypothetical protein [Tanacetum cinerariifolium]
MNYQPVTAGNQTNHSACFQDKFDAEKAGEEVDQQYVLFLMWSSGSTNPQNYDGNAAFNGKEHDFDAKKPESEVILSPSSSAQSRKQDDKTKKEAKGKSLVESFTGYRDLSAEFEDCSDNSSNEVSVAGTIVPTVTQNSSNNTNPFSAAGLSITTASPTHGKSSFIDAYQLPNDPDMPELEDITYSYDENDVGAEPDLNNLENSITVSPIPTTRIHKNHPVSQIIGDLSFTTQTRSMTKVVKDQGRLLQMFNDDFHTCMFACFLSQKEPKRVHQALKDPSWIEAMQEELLQFKLKKVWVLVDLPHGKRAIGTKWVFRNKKNERGIVVRNKARFVTQGHTHEEGIKGKIDQTLFIKKQKGDILLVQIYVDDIIFGATDKDLCKSFEKLMKDKFQMSSMGELTFFLGLQVKQKNDGIFINQDKYVAKILRKFGLTEGKSTSTPIDTEKPLLKDPDGEDVDVHTYRSMIGSLMYLTSSRLDIMFAYKKQTVVATSSTEAEYVAAASCCAQSDASEGFTHIIDFLNGSYIKYALKVNPNIYVSCIKQFWTTVAIKHVNDVTRLQALLDKKKVMVTEAAIREVIRLDDAEGVDCLPNEEIFTELARIGYEKPSTKLTFYKAFFSSQWKFLIHTILHSMCAKRTSWNKFSSSMASAVICLSTGRKFNFSKYIFDSLVRNVDSTTKFYMYPRFLQLLIRKQVGDLSTHTTKYASPALTQKVFENMMRVGKGFSGVETPLFKGMLVGQEIKEEGDEDEHVEDVTAGDDTQGDDTVAHGKFLLSLKNHPYHLRPHLLYHHNHLKISLQHLRYNTLYHNHLRRLQRVGTSQRIDTSDDTMIDDESNQGRMIDEMDKDDVVVLMDEKEEDKKVEEAKEDEPAKVQEVVDVVTTAKLITEVVTTSSEIVTAASAIISTVEPQVPGATLTAAPLKVVAAPSKRSKGVVIRDPKEESTTSSIISTETKSKDKGKGIMLKDKEDPAIKIYQAMKRKPQTEAQAQKNMMIYLKNVAGFKLDYFKGISYDDIHLIFEAKFNSNEVEDLKRNLEIVPDEDDDVYTEATTLARKVLVVDYKIIELNNKPYYKIIRADGTHQLYISFLTLLKNFNIEDLEALWNLVKERFSTTKPKNFSDDFLLTTLGAMFQKPDALAQVWNNQRTIHGHAKVKSWKLLESCGVHIITFRTTQVILLVERRYPLSRFTLDQMLNVVSLQVEEESEVSLELLRFTRQQHQEGQLE